MGRKRKSKESQSVPPAPTVTPEPTASWTIPPKIDLALKVMSPILAVVAICVSVYSAWFATSYVPARDARMAGMDHTPNVRMWFSDSKCVLENDDNFDIFKVSLHAAVSVVDLESQYVVGGVGDLSSPTATAELLGYHTQLSTDLNQRALAALDRGSAGILRCDDQQDCVLIAECRAVFHRAGDRRRFQRRLFASVNKLTGQFLLLQKKYGYGFDASAEFNALDVVTKRLGWFENYEKDFGQSEIEPLP